MDDSVKAYKDFLKWRDDNNIDKIRQDIVYGGKDSAFKFPFGELALAVAPQIILTANAQDKKGRLLGKLLATNASTTLFVTCLHPSTLLYTNISSNGDIRFLTQRTL